MLILWFKSVTLFIYDKNQHTCVYIIMFKWNETCWRAPTIYYLPSCSFLQQCAISKDCSIFSDRVTVAVLWCVTVCWLVPPHSEYRNVTPMAESPTPVCSQESRLSTHGSVLTAAIVSKHSEITINAILNCWCRLRSHPFQQ